MKIIPIKCPSCGASLDIQDGRKNCFCQYCGEHIHLDDENRVITNVQIVRNEAQIKEAEIKAKRLEFEIEQQREQKKAEEKKAKIRVMCIILFIVSFGALLMLRYSAEALGIPSSIMPVLITVTWVASMGGLLGIAITSGNKNQKKK